MWSKCKKIKEALLSVTDNVGHYEAIHKTEGSSVEGDNRKINQSIQGTIDYFTKEEGDAFVEQIQAALKAACISFYLNSVQYEGQDEGGAGYIHYEWVWEVA